MPRVLEIGDAFDDVVFAISERFSGAFLEAVDEPAPAIAQLLRGLRNAGPDEVPYSWRDWLQVGMSDDGHNAAWLPTVRELPVARAVEARVRSLLDACPQRNDLIHGDLVHGNVLVDGDALSAVFSWKCSARGDALFDVAWLTFWGTWMDAIRAADPWSLAEVDGDDAAIRHHCYELHIGLTHLCWYTQVQDAEWFGRIKGRLSDLLESGPLVS